MFKKLSVTTSVLLLSGCGASPMNLLPGMQNLDTWKMRKHVRKERIHVTPTLIPITPTLIADAHVNTYFYRVAPSDVIRVSVWEHPEFSPDGGVNTSLGEIGSQGGGGASGYLVNPKGQIYFPLIGYVAVGGKTLDEIRIEVSKRLQKYIPNPQVNVRVAEFRGQRMYVLGEVLRKGFLPINDQPMTIADALALSGWIDSNAADPSNIYVIRGSYTRPEVFWLDMKTPDKVLLAEHFSLQPKDVLYVSAAPITQINRVLDQVLPIVQTIWFTQSIVKQSTKNS
ncbi:MAG: polysaccharide biosynthesis/export family protein [Legionellaceae bacterium]|nr:polysaccharide biosynthesis/export family protein [Legionellaceae bacterium]